MVSKAKIAIAIIISLFVLEVQAQDFGIKGGLNSATIGGDSEGVEAKTSFHVGIMAPMRASEYYVFQPEFIYSAQGAKIAGTTGTANYNYFNVPLISKFYPSGRGFNFQTGPQLGILISANLSDGTNSVDVKNEINDVDLALGMGIGYDIDASVSIDLRYNIGLSNTAKDSGNQSFPNAVLQFSVGAYF